MIIDTDTHMIEPADLWTSRLQKSWGDQVMHVRWIDEFSAEMWCVGDKVVREAWLGCQYGFDGWPHAPARRSDCDPATVEQAERVRLMDQVGIRTAVLYPHIAGLNATNFESMSDEIANAHISAYNDYQIEYCSVFPHRFVPMLVIPFWNLEASIKEITRATGHGFGGIVMTGVPQHHGQPFLADYHWDRLWHACVDAGLSVSFHIANGDTADADDSARTLVDPPYTSLARQATFPILDNGKQISDLLLSGILPRFPTLKFASVESGIGWVPFVLESLDYHYKRMTKTNRNLPWGDMLPSDFCRRQVYFNVWFEKLEQWHLDTIGEDRILFETDFPHPTCLRLDEVRRAVTSNLGGWPEKVVEKVFGATPLISMGLTSKQKLALDLHNQCLMFQRRAR